MDNLRQTTTALREVNNAGEVAEYLRISLPTLKALLNSGRMRAVRAGRNTMQRAKLDRDEDEPTDRTTIHFGCLKMSEAEQFPPFEIEFSFPEGLLTTRFLGGSVSRTVRQGERDFTDIERVLRGVESLSGPEIVAASGVARDRAYVVLRGPKIERIG